MKNDIKMKKFIFSTKIYEMQKNVNREICSSEKVLQTCATKSFSKQHSFGFIIRCATKFPLFFFFENATLL